MSTVDRRSDWMSEIPNQYSITNVSIPGTHETMSLYGGPPKKCQSLSLTQQYEAGIRFVDIRCRHYQDELPIFHSEVPQRANFDDVLKATAKFLHLHPKEVILMRLKEEYKPQDNTKTFAQTVQGYIDRYPRELFYRGESYPTMSDVRGKLVVLRDYEGPADYGLPYADLDIEDLWQVPSLLPPHINTKWHATRSQLEKAARGPASTVLYLTHTSGTSAFAFPEAVAERLNKYLSDFLTVDTKVDWMARVPDKYSTANISIPGTHESMSLHGGETTQCQNTTLTQQFDNGIRFVDIRCRLYNNELQIYHGIVPQKASFDDVLKNTTKFLDEHAKEVIFMRVREEDDPENSTITFANAVQVYVNRYPAETFYHGKGYPTMSAARGKLVILRDYSGPATFGLNYNDLDIEDQWRIDFLSKEEIQKKWNAVHSHLEKASKGPVSKMYLTYSSGAGIFAWPDDVAERLNKLLAGYLNGTKAKWGMIAMDFPNAKLITMIIESNFKDPTVC